MVYCPKCGAQMDENDAFCEKCGAAVEGKVPKKVGPVSAGKAKSGLNQKQIGIVAVALVAILLVVLVVKGFGGKEQGGSGPVSPVGEETGEPNGMEEEEEEEEDDVLAHLKPWMGEWVVDSSIEMLVPGENARFAGIIDWYDAEGFYYGYLTDVKNAKGRVHVTEDGIDFTEVTKDERFNFPIEALTYTKSAAGGDAFEVEDRDLRIVFFDNYIPDKSADNFGQVMRVQAYVGVFDYDPQEVGHHPDPDGWATEVYHGYVRPDNVVTLVE